MTQSVLAKKLLIKPGYRVALVNAPAEYESWLGELPTGVTLLRTLNGQYDMVHLFAYTKADVNQLALAAIDAVKPGGLLWMSYRKQVPKGEERSVHRDIGWETVYQAGWEGIALIAIDDLWAAMRFRPSVEVKSSSPHRAKMAEAMGNKEV
jgi:predicted CoA-binding protein